VATAKWALSKSAEPPSSTIVEPVDPEPWEGVGISDANENVRVTATGVTSEQIVVTPYDSKLARKTPKAYFKIVLKIENVGSSNVKYAGWSARQDNLEQAAKLKDDTGATVEQALGDVRVVGQTGSASIRPGTSVEEILIFQPPPTYARYLKLALPAEASGGTGNLRIKIPRTRVVD
ncbi:MAG TPA: hypothetical protein VFG04_04735, partial [Planctomycetaceae bacterium]|nr:hypothetical protein [Planctomycetaceae bacterium]